MVRLAKLGGRGSCYVVLENPLKGKFVAIFNQCVLGSIFLNYLCTLSVHTIITTLLFHSPSHHISPFHHMQKTVSIFLFFPWIRPLFFTPDSCIQTKTVHKKHTHAIAREHFAHFLVDSNYFVAAEANQRHPWFLAKGTAEGRPLYANAAIVCAVLKNLLFVCWFSRSEYSQRSKLRRQRIWPSSRSDANA